MDRTISYNWLKEFVPLDVSPANFAREFSLRSMTVDRVTPVKPEFTGVTTAKIIKIEKHPNADRLRLATVKTKQGTATVVCGAPNIAEGQIVPYAGIGAKLIDTKDGGKKFTLKAAIIRDIKSEGMLCSPAELGIGEDHGGIFILPKETQIGKPLEEVLPLHDSLFDIEITSNRPDAMSVVGLAREAAAVFNKKLTQKLAQPKITFTDEIPLSVEVKDSSRCPRYQAVVVTGITVGPSPLWMQLRLSQAGVRPINNIVDITNYVLLELGQPMHAFDYDKLQGKTIVVRRAQKGEKIVALDGKTYSLAADLVIADSKNPVAIAGVMGGEKSAVSAETKTIVFECANFDPITVRTTSRRLSLLSESSLLFEKGLQPQNVEAALFRALELTQQLAGGSVSSPIIDVYAKAKTAATISFDPAVVQRYLGVAVPQPEIKTILTHLGFAVSGAKKISVTIPWWRAGDVAQEFDLVEEVARMYGYHTLPSRLPAGMLPGRHSDLLLRFEDTIKDILAGAGFNEVYHYSMISAELLKKFGMKPTEALPIANPLNEELGLMRPVLSPQLLATVAENLNHDDNFSLFELSNTYQPAKEKSLPAEVSKLAAALVGPDGLLRAKGVVELLFERLGIVADFQSQTERLIWWQRGSALDVMAGKTVLGHIGIVSEKMAKDFGIEVPVALLTFDVGALFKQSRPVTAFEPIPEFPAIQRDVATVVADTVSWLEIAGAVSRVDDLITDVVYLNTFSDVSLGAKKKSIAFRIVLRSRERTLKSTEADAVIDKIIDTIKKQFNAQLR